MNPGKVSNSILKRSVLKQIKKREEYAAKPAIGVDCAYISLQKKDKPAVLEPVVTVTVIGLCDGKNLSAKNIHPGQDVILTKWIGISGIRQIIAKNRPEILRFYREDVIEKAQGNAQDMSVGEEAFLAAQAGVTGMHDVSEGGIFAALWDMAEAGDGGEISGYLFFPWNRLYEQRQEFQ